MIGFAKGRRTDGEDASAFRHSTDEDDGCHSSEHALKQGVSFPRVKTP